MADNVTANAGTGGATLATDDIAGVHYPRTKLSWGVDGSAVDASATNPLPVQVPDGSDATFGAKADDKSPATDTTAVSAMAVWKQISASIQALAAAAKAEDTASANADPGLVLLSKRSDTPATTSGTDGDYEPLQVAAGRVWTWAGRTPTYGSKTAITWTGTSLANGSARESTVVTNTAKYADARIRFQSKGQAGGTNYVDVYVYTALGDTTYVDGATGSDAAFTAANRMNSRYLGSLKLDAATQARQVEFQMSDIFTTMPDKWGLIIINNSGAALSATAGDHVIEYEGIY